MQSTLWGVGAYVIAQLLIGVYVSRRVRTESDYLLAGRRFGYGLGVFSIFATWFGAETCIGAAGAIYERGLSAGSADPFGYGLCILFMGLVFAVPLWNRQLTTLADLFRTRFSPGVERLAVLMMVPTSLLWAAAQIRAFGLVLGAEGSLQVDVAISTAAVVVILYTVSGGLLADAVTDVVQGVVLILGLIFTLVAISTATEGIGPVLARLPAERLSLFDPNQPVLEMMEAWAVPICGSVVAQELIARVLASRSPTVARRSTFIAGGAYLLVGLIPAVLGLVAHELLPGLTDSETALPGLAAKYLSPLGATIFVGALVSAILSTVDSALLVAGSLISHNLVAPLRPSLTDAEKLRIARIGVLLCGVLAYALALHGESTYALVEDASSFGSAGIFVLMVFGLFSRIGGRLAAHASLLAGMSVWIYGSYVGAWTAPYLSALVAAFGAYLAGAGVSVLHHRRAAASG